MNEVLDKTLEIECFSTVAKQVITAEIEELNNLRARIDTTFNKACKLILNCRGRVILTGIGKSGHIANKIASTLASTGTPALYVHPAEASHGDLGMITKSDIIIALSYSGASDELLLILPHLQTMGTPIISMCGNKNSPLARYSDVFLDVSITKEACPFNLAPTSSTTIALVMGDALAIALLKAREFNIQDFARSHPGGNLGRKLLITVDNLMHSGTELPKVNENSRLSESLLEISSKGLGMTTVVDANGILVGVFTDGDLRRALNNSVNIQATSISTLMTKKFISVASGTLAFDALNIMRKNKINGLVVTNTNNVLLGCINMHDLLRAKIM